MTQPGRKFTQGSSSYKYGFGGKEKSFEISVDDYDFGARIYDGRIVKFLSLDPYYSKFPMESNYAFAGNNPIQFVDANGEYKIDAADLASYRKKYPLIVKYFESQIKIDVLKSQKIINAFNDFRKNNTNKNLVSNPHYLEDILTWGSGPTIKFEKDPGFPVSGAHGHYTRGCEPSLDVLELSSSDAAKLEKILGSKANAQVKQKEFMKFYQAVLHETAHEVNSADKVLKGDARFTCPREDETQSKYSYGGEDGYEFEQKVWGNDKYKPLDVYMGPGIQNQNSYTPCAVEDVIENANKTEEGKKTLPTVPVAVSAKEK